MTIKSFVDTYSLPIGLGLVLSAAWTFIIGSLFMIVGGSLGQLSSVGILVISIGAAIWIASRNQADRRDKYIVAGAVMAVLLLSVLTSGLIIDTSIDGQSYHFHAVESLVSGWNPFYEEVPSLPHTPDMQPAIWVSHYPMGSWLVNAIEHAAGLPLENSKGVNLVLLAGSGFLAIGVLSRVGYGILASLLIGSIAAANPVTLVQLFTRMNDGLMASLIVSLVMLAVLAIHMKDRKVLLYTIPLMILTLNLKFSAVPIMVALCAYVCIAAWIVNGRDDALKTASYLVAAGVAGICIIGFSPYASNILNYGHPFYPLMGAEDTRDIMQGNTPEFLEGMNHLEAFLFSLFAETHSGFEQLPSLKLPFMVSPSEIRTSGGPDVRIAGFGPLFSAGVFLATPAGLAAAWIFRRRKLVTVPLIVAAALFFLAAIFPESWWARYVPYLWLVPLCVALASIGAPDRAFKMIGFVIVLILGLNASMVALTSVYLAGNRSVEAMDQIHQMRAEGVDYEIEFDLALSRSKLMRNAGLSIQIVDELTCTDCVSTQKIAAYGPDRTGGVICELP